MFALGMSALTACDLDAVLNIGGYGRNAEPVGGSRSTMPKEDVMAIQQALHDLGYAPGPVDGVAGAKTRSAIRRYQAVAGLPEDGETTPALLESLRSNPVPATAGAEALPPPDVGPEVAKDDVVIDGSGADLPPLYEPGDVFAWSNGLVETVIRVGGERIFWRGNDGASFNADRNFVIPPSSWDRASGPGSAIVSIDTAQLWPFRQGRRVSFEVLTTGPSGVESARDWLCFPRGNRKITVPAGTFDTQVITCGRSAVADGEWRYRTWFYAPAARHYVRRVDRFSDGSVQAIGLVAIRPGGEQWPAAARAGLDWAIQDVLNGQLVGSRTDWSSTSVRADFSIMPTGFRKANDGRMCRTFVLIRKSRDVERSYPAIACRNQETGIWLVPVLDEGAAPASGFVTLG
jgi:peptidoglycan hydrolase-like protein with peptidoglycan-binding domain